MYKLLVVVVIVGCGSKSASVPSPGKRDNLELAKQTADRALEQCSKLYKEPDGCFRYTPPQAFGESGPAIAIGELWSGDKADVDHLQAKCVYSRESFEKLFVSSKPNDAIAGVPGSPTCWFRPYPGMPASSAPGTPECSTGAPAPGYDFMSNFKPANGEVVLVPREEKCAGQWETIQVRRVSPEGYYVDVEVWLRAKH